MTTVVVSHDAGGAEILSSWALRQGAKDLRYVLSGPAVAIFERKIPRTPMKSFEAVDFMLCGSSVSDSLEKRMTRWALRSGIPCAVYLDHWKNYRLRFESGEDLGHRRSEAHRRTARILPDEVWVTDRWAATLAETELPEATIRIKGNPYLEDIVREVRMLRYARSGLVHVLYVHEPGREKEFRRWAGQRFGPRQLLRERPHPSVAPAERTLAEDIAWSDVVVGCDSMAMAIALRAGREVYSVLPKQEQLTIPFPGIKRG